MVYLNSAARRRRRPRSSTPRADRRGPRRRGSTPWPRPGTPRPASPSSPRIVPTAEAYGIDPAREGYPDLIALPDEPYWVRTKLAPGTAWVEADPNLPGTHRPEGIVALAGAGHRPRPDARRPTCPTSPRRS